MQQHSQSQLPRQMPKWREGTRKRCLQGCVHRFPQSLGHFQGLILLQCWRTREYFWIQLVFAGLKLHQRVVMGSDESCSVLMPLPTLVIVFILKSVWVLFSLRGTVTRGRENKTSLFHVQFCSMTSHPLLRDCPPQRIFK